MSIETAAAVVEMVTAQRANTLDLAMSCILQAFPGDTRCAGVSKEELDDLHDLVTVS